jgi:hypothetical protein
VDIPGITHIEAVLRARSRYRHIDRVRPGTQASAR